jgi:uncharacterized membrane protein HdeD (DUF308 family)
MFAYGKMTDQVQTRKAMAFLGNLMALLGLLVLGFPLTPATIRTMLLGWLLIAVAITRFVMGHHCADDRILDHFEDCASRLGRYR